jgi:hypothetical protein
MRVGFCVFAVICIFGVAAHGQKDNSKPHRFIVEPTSFVKAEAFVDLSKADRMMYTSGLIDGFFASALFGGNDASVAGLNSCLKEMDSEQVTAILTKYVKDHPERWHYPMSIEAFSALNDACPGGLKAQ